MLDIRPAPFEKLTARRRLPHIAVTGGYPLLRLGKPQSPFLSRVLRDKLKQKQKELDRAQELELQEEIGRTEDEWEAVVERTTRRVLYREGPDGLQPKKSWRTDTRGERARIQQDFTRETRKAREAGERMARIVEKEKALAQEERKLRKHLKLEAKKARKLQEKGTETPPEDSV